MTKEIVDFFLGFWCSFVVFKIDVMTSRVVHVKRWNAKLEVWQSTLGSSAAPKVSLLGMPLGLCFGTYYHFIKVLDGFAEKVQQVKVETYQNDISKRIKQLQKHAGINQPETYSHTWPFFLEKRVPVSQGTISGGMTFNSFHAFSLILLGSFRWDTTNNRETPMANHYFSTNLSGFWWSLSSQLMHIWPRVCSPA